MIKKILIAFTISMPLIANDVLAIEPKALENIQKQVDYYNESLILETENHDKRIAKIEDYYNQSMTMLIATRTSDIGRENRLHQLNLSKNLSDESIRHNSEITRLTNYFQTREAEILLEYNNKKNREIARSDKLKVHLEKMNTKYESKLISGNLNIGP